MATAPPTRAVNLRTEAYDVYIGRAGHGMDGYFGNPYRSNGDSRDATIARFEAYFLARVACDVDFRSRVLALRGLRLGCFCKPHPCHGDVIARWVDAHSPMDNFPNPDRAAGDVDFREGSVE